ncbi:MAG: hypothetical protein RI990_477, partial [Planctomycetota bacterium]
MDTVAPRQNAGNGPDRWTTRRLV